MTDGSFKKELVHDERYATRAEARAGVFECVESFSNRVRLHSSLGYVSPAEFERAHNPSRPSLRHHFPWGTPGLALRAFLRLEVHCFARGICWVEAKGSIARDALRACLEQPHTLLPRVPTA